jgi:dihydroorotate dehydrogenase electron transfer subunit
MSRAARIFSEARVLGSREVARDTFVLRYSIELEAPVAAGQFAMVHPGNDDRYVLPRPLSILDYREGELDLLIKLAGRGSLELARMSSGDEVRIFAPLGTGFSLDEFRGRPTVLVAGGVGVVPLHLLSRRLKATGEQPRPIFGARAPRDLPLEILGDEPAGPWELWVEEGRTGELRKGLVTVGLNEVLDELPDAIVATCGPTPMMQAVARICRERSVPLRVCLEEQMGCGAGVCRACVVDYKTGERRRTVCHDGPVFDVSTIRFLPEDLDGTLDEVTGRCAP